jgi:hypothetical protein
MLGPKTVSNPHTDEHKPVVITAIQRQPDSPQNSFFQKSTMH